MSNKSDETSKTNVRKEGPSSSLVLNGLFNPIIDNFDEDEASTPRKFSSPSQGSKTALQLGNLLISSAPSLSGSQHSDPSSMSSPNAKICSFIPHASDKEEDEEISISKTGTKKPIEGVKLVMDPDAEVEICKESEKDEHNETKVDEKRKEDENGEEEKVKEHEVDKDNEIDESYPYWETRIADYFVVIGTDTKDTSAKTYSDDIKKAFTAKVLDRTPEVDYKDTRLPGGLEIFCFPNGIDGTISKENTDPISSMFSLTTEDGTRLYVTSLRIYEHVREILEDEWGETEGKTEKKGWYMPFCICIISHWPFFSLYKEFLLSVYAKINSTDSDLSDLGTYIADFMFNTPVPSPGTLELEYGDSQHLRLPYPEDFPYVDVNE